MIRTNPPKNKLPQELALELFSSESYLVVNKKLLQHFGPEKTVFISNLIDKFKYFKTKGMVSDDNFFFQQHEKQIAETGLTNYSIQKCKKELKKENILIIERRGIPSREWIKIDFGVLLKSTGVVGVHLSNSSTVHLSNSLGVNNKETINKENKDIYLSLAEKLSQIIQSRKNVRHTPSQIKGWSNEILRLVNQAGVSRKRIRNALKWYEQHIGEQYVPAIESGRSLREKFIRLEAAIERDGKNTLERSERDGSTPQQIFGKYLEPSQQKRDWVRYCVRPAIDLFSNPVEEYDKELEYKLAHAMCHIDNWYQNKQKTMPIHIWNLIPDSFHLIEQYVQWLNKQDWLDEVRLGHFDQKSKVFRQFLNQYQKEVGLDFFDGSAL
jgi:hypothetical protein